MLQLSKYKILFQTYKQLHLFTPVFTVIIMLTQDPRDNNILMHCEEWQKKKKLNEAQEIDIFDIQLNSQNQ